MRRVQRENSTLLISLAVVFVDISNRDAYESQRIRNTNVGIFNTVRVVNNHCIGTIGNIRPILIMALEVI